MLERTAATSGPELGRGAVSPRGFGPPVDRDLVPGPARGARRTLRKVFPSDEVAALEREREALELARGPGVPEVYGRGRDRSNRPWIELQWVGEEDLRMRVAGQGPLPAAEVFDFGRQAARILARLHAVPLAHGDVKPANVVVSEAGELFLVDFENAVRGGAAADPEVGLATRFTGGTYGYAPPEAYLGHAVTQAFDLFGLGATLHYLLTACLPPRRKDGSFDPGLLLRLRPCLPHRVLRVVCDLLATAPRARPAAARVLAELDARTGPVDPALEQALLTGSAHGSTEQAGPLRLRAHWRRKLTRVLDTLPPTPDDLPSLDVVEGALRFCRAMHLCMSFVPLLEVARKRLRRAQHRLPDLLRALPGAVQRRRQDLELHEARHLARLSVDLCRLVSVLNLTDRSAPHLIQTTGHTLQSALKRLDLEEARQRSILTRLDDAEARLDLAAARTALADLLETFPGANPTTARVRDKHQRFLWLLERLVAGREGLAAAVAFLESAAPVRAVETGALVGYVDHAAAALDREVEAPHRSLALLGRVFAELADGYPRLELGKATAQLASVRRALTERSILLLEQMAGRLEVDPVPLRLLLRDLVEVDRVLMLDCLVDSDRMTRTELLDRLERLRLRIEEVSDKHRRIAAGARQQIEQGRLTTALYDLERALEASSSDDDRRGGELARELEQVRRLREEVRNATRRNLELAELYARLEDDPEAALDDRLECLEQREAMLHFLLDKGPAAFRQRYQVELRELRGRRVEDICEDAEERLRTAAGPDEQLAIAGGVLARVGAETASAPEDGRGRHAALARRWQSYYERARHDALVERERELAEVAATRTRRAVVALLLVTAVVAVIALAL